ncbi:FG-GAP repeat domain protein [hydrothermal vent metagenome]|uniref:FG-GAP repeat domain protein n=1 Tax=hydrothermal vent metagenome TaxID=652676 RepID=A0A3B0U106_9ZZZZ
MRVELVVVVVVAMLLTPYPAQAAQDQAGPQATPLFVDRAKELDLSEQYTGGWEFFVGGGVAAFDCNGDLLPELYLAGGSAEATLLRNTTKARGNDISMVAATPDILRQTGVIGAYPLDINSDGILDLFILRVGENLLLKGGADCSFTPFDGLGFDGGNSWTTAFSASWEKGNILPTLAVGNYVDRSDPKGPFEACDNNYLFRPRGDKYPAPIVLKPGYCALSMLFSDWGRNGRQDLRVSNDRHYYVRGGLEQMWAMEAKPRLFTAADGWKEYSIWGMGIASRDIDGDGFAEVFLSSMGDQKLQRYDPSQKGPAFVDMTYEVGATAQRPYKGDDGRPSTGWQISFGDVDNDGLDDVFIAKGNVEEMPSTAMKDPNNLLMQQKDGTFTEAGGVSGLGTTERSRGAALIDLNLDGKLDVVVVNRNAPVEINQNVSANVGNWLALDLSEDGANRDAVGAWIEVKGKVSSKERRWSREITVGGGDASGVAAPEHFGLGALDKVSVRVIWPDGVKSRWYQVKANQILRLERRGAGLDISVL